MWVGVCGWVNLRKRMCTLYIHRSMSVVPGNIEGGGGGEMFSLSMHHFPSLQ